MCGVPNSTEWSLLIFASLDDYKMWWWYLFLFFFIYRGRQCIRTTFSSLRKIKMIKSNIHACVVVYEGFGVEYHIRENLHDSGIIYCKLSVEEWILYGRCYYDSVIHWLNSQILLKFMAFYVTVKRYWKWWL